MYTDSELKVTKKQWKEALDSFVEWQKTPNKDRCYKKVVQLYKKVTIDAINSFSKPRILDIGCGTDKKYNTITNLREMGITLKGITYWGIDPLLKRNTGLRLKATAESIPFIDNFFNIVLAYAVLDNVLDLNKTFSEIYRVLESNGILLIITMLNDRVVSSHTHAIDVEKINFLAVKYNFIIEKYQIFENLLLKGIGFFKLRIVK